MANTPRRSFTPTPAESTCALVKEAHTVGNDVALEPLAVLHPVPYETLAKLLSCPSFPPFVNPIASMIFAVKNVPAVYRTTESSPLKLITELLLTLDVAYEGDEFIVWPSMYVAPAAS